MLEGFWTMQLQLMATLAQSDRKKYPDHAVRKWKETELSDDIPDAKEQVQMRHTQLQTMTELLVTQAADLDKIGKLYAELEQMKIQNGQLNKRIVDMQQEQDDLRDQMAELESAHRAEMKQLNEKWSEKMEGMTKSQYTASLEALKSRMNDVENHVRGFDETLVMFEHGLKDPDEDETRVFNSMLDEKRRAELTKDVGSDDLEAQLAQVEARIEQALRDLLAIKTDADNKIAALAAMLQKRADSAAEQAAKMAANVGKPADKESQYDAADLPEHLQPQDKEVQAAKASGQDAEAQTDLTGELQAKADGDDEEAKEFGDADAQTEGYFALEALAVRQAQREAGIDDSDMPMVDPDALHRIEELLATLDDKEAEITGLKNARETLTTMLANRTAAAAPEPEPEPEPEPVVVYPGASARLRPPWRHLSEKPGCVLVLNLPIIGRADWKPEGEPVYRSWMHCLPTAAHKRIIARFGCRDDCRAARGAAAGVQPHNDARGGRPRLDTGHLQESAQGAPVLPVLRGSFDAGLRLAYTEAAPPFGLPRG